MVFGNYLMIASWKHETCSLTPQIYLSTALVFHWATFKADEVFSLKWRWKKSQKSRNFGIEIFEREFSFEIYHIQSPPKKSSIFWKIMINEKGLRIDPKKKASLNFVRLVTSQWNSGIENFVVYASVVIDQFKFTGVI